MGQPTYSLLGTNTSATAGQASLTLPATAIGPATGTATTGISMVNFDGFLVLTVTSAAVALATGLAISGQDAKATAAMAPLVTYNVPAAAVQVMAYHYGPKIGASAGVSSAYASASGFIMDKMQFTATAGATSTVQILVYGYKF